MPELADVTDANISGDVVFDSIDGARMLAVPSNSEAQQLVTGLRRRAVDLPDIPERMHTISMVLTYELFGLPKIDIAAITGFSEEQVGNIMMLDAYAAMRSDVVESIRQADTDNVRSMFAKKSARAAERIVELADSARPDIALSASREVLDRGGHSVKQIVEHTHKLEGGLVIEHVKRDNSQAVPTIEPDYKVIEDAKLDKEASENDGSSSTQSRVRTKSRDTAKRSKRVQPSGQGKPDAKRRTSRKSAKAKKE